ncbi:hypothetical protein DD238_008188 [Peronospora effusa]|uniref:Uncharacterized protein n=1 Tax=Peronospora effusa TaxID=542832 RepID=A0A3M6V773_9STRA|nr:hypothetical protein DD238_008188 [Peronospora effusa]
MASMPPSPRAPESSNKRKRKRKSQSKALSTSSSCTPSSISCSSSVDTQLQTLENWHRVLTIDLREVRREGSRVRMELEKVEHTVESAVEKAEHCALQAQRVQEYMVVVNKAKDDALEETKRQFQAAEARYKTKIKTLNKMLITMDKKLERHMHSSITEELLLTQLTEFQEQYENELRTIRDDYAAMCRTQKKQLKQMEKLLLKVVTKQKNETKHMEQTLRDDTAHVSQQVRQLVTRQELYLLQQQVEVTKKEHEDEHERMRMNVKILKERVVDVEKRGVETDTKVLEVVKTVEDGITRAMMSTPAPLPQKMSSSHLAQDFVRQADLDGIHDVLRRINRDFQAVAVDFTSLAKTTEARGNQQEQQTEAKLQELSTQLFDALSHDSRLHATGISRLKDVMFDMQNKYCVLDQRIKRLEDDVQQVRADRVQARPPQDYGREPGWRYRHDFPSFSTRPQPPTPGTFRNCQERPSRYEPAPVTRKTLTPPHEPPPPGRISWAPRREARSRSRSPPHRLSWRASGQHSLYSDSKPAAPAQNGSQCQHDGRSGPRSNNGGNATPNLPSQPIHSLQGVHGDTLKDATEHSQEEVTIVPCRRNRQLRKTPEVIVIEEDDDDDDDDNDDDDDDDDDDEDEDEGETARAPPEVVLDEEVLQPADVVMVAPGNSTSAGHVDSADVVQKEEDLQTGCWLYFCLGGAPDLDVQWTPCFTQLKANECVEMPRVLRFQRQYVFLQGFPVYLTQCILQAVIVNGHIVPAENGPKVSGITGTLNAESMRVKFDNTVNEIHLSWAKALVEHLTTRAGAIDDLALEKLELSVNPAGLSSNGDKDDVIYGWSRRQESVMWILARQLHYGSLLPAMTCNVNASPSVYLFALMFDVLTVTSECPQSGTFRLNNFGGTLLAHLWDHTLKKLPYVFFADWAWLEDQSTKKVMPALAFCHILASILLWNSAIDRHSLTNRNIYAAAMKHILPKLCVDDQSVRESTANVGSLQLAEWESTHIELRDLDSKFASMLGLDGFFEVMEAIQNNRQAVAAPAEGQASAT